MSLAVYLDFVDKDPDHQTIHRFVDHIEYVCERIGDDHVGFGSDFDGVGDTMPEGLRDVSHYPNLIMGLLKRGYSEKEIQKISSENILRLWEEVERIAEFPEKND